jgi:hypothetical protein
MPEWKPRTLDDLARFVFREFGRSKRRSVETVTRADLGVEIGTEAGQVADAANQAAEAASNAASDAAGVAAAAASQAATAAGIAGGKADVFIQDTAPSADYQKATTLWIDTTNDGNKPKRWNASTSTWTVVTDKAATDAAAAAVAAGNLAQNAKDVADQAKQSADAANAAATNALTTANGKNTIRFRTVAPTTSAADKGAADGDFWFVIPNTQTGIVTGQYQWMAATQTWVQQTLSSAVLASIDAGKITTGTLVGITITGVTITGATVTGGTVQTAATGKRVVMANNVINFYNTRNEFAGRIEGTADGAASGGTILLSTGGSAVTIGRQSLAFGGASDLATTTISADTLVANYFFYPDGTPILSDSTWIRVTSFLNGYTAAQPVYYRRINGIVYLRGQLYNANPGQDAFVLPVGYRPSTQGGVFVGGVSAWDHYTQVSASGVVSVTSAVARTSSTGYPLDGVSFVGA